MAPKTWFFKDMTVKTDVVDKPADKTWKFILDQTAEGKTVNAAPANNRRLDAPSEPKTPNKVANGTSWDYRVAWDSNDLASRQTTLETYSAEVAMLFEAVRQIASNAIGKQLTNDDLKFFANFGSPIVNNAQLISITLERPVSLKIMLMRKLIDGKLDWSCDVGLTDTTPINVSARLSVAKKSGPLESQPITTTDEQQPDDVKRRKVRI
jgi:hypothetical protein